MSLAIPTTSKISSCPNCPHRGSLVKGTNSIVGKKSLVG